jgi:queuosine precursor transporter
MKDQLADSKIVNSTGLVGLFLAAIVAANLIITRFGPQATVITAFLFIGLDITARDRLHESWCGRHLWVKMAALIAAGSALSWVVNRDAGQIALASFVAFAASGAADSIVYHGLRNRAWMVKVNGSNVVSAAIDSLIFPTLAFGVLLPAVVIGQFVAKVAGGAAWAALLRFRLR